LFVIKVGQYKLACISLIAHTEAVEIF
jgi:hypothetical protein